MFDDSPSVDELIFVFVFSLVFVLEVTLLSSLELVLVITAVSSITYLIQKNKMKKLYEGSRPKNK